MQKTSKDNFNGQVFLEQLSVIKLKRVITMTPKGIRSYSEPAESNY